MSEADIHLTCVAGIPLKKRMAIMATPAQIIDQCHHALTWLIPVLDRMPKSRRYTLAQQFIEN